jgi:hypothetical protein
MPVSLSLSLSLSLPSLTCMLVGDRLGQSMGYGLGFCLFGDHHIENWFARFSAVLEG